MYLIVGLVAILVILGLIAYFKQDVIIESLRKSKSFLYKYKKKLITLFISSLAVTGGGLALSNLDDGGNPYMPDVEATMLIDSLSDYEDLGYNLSKIVDPVLYEEQVLCEGHMPLLIEFDMKSSLNMSKSSLKDFVYATEKYKKNMGDIDYKFNILMNESYIRGEPVYKEEKYEYNETIYEWNNKTILNPDYDKEEANVNESYNTSEYITVTNRTAVGNETKVGVREVVDYYEKVKDYKYVWRGITELDYLEILSQDKVIIDIVGDFSAGLGSRVVDIIPNIKLDKNLYTFEEYAWWNSNWQYKKKITLNSSQIPSTLTNFPVCINITDTDLRDNAQSDGDDIVFVNSAEDTKLNHEIEKYDNTDGSLTAWVNIISLAHDVDTEIYMYYGNAEASNQQNPTDVWDSDYIMVQHFDESDIDGGAGDIKDSTSNNNDGTTHNMDSNDAIDAKIDGGFDFGGSNDYVHTSTGLVHGKSKVSIGIFANADSSSFGLGNWDAWNTGTTYYMHHGGASLRDASFNILNLDITTINSGWGFVTVTWNSGTGKIYGNGTLEDSGSIGNSVLGDGTDFGTYIGARRDDGGWSGRVDEVFVYDDVLSDEYINTRWNNYNNATSGENGFFSLGSEERPGVVFSNQDPANESLNVELGPTCSLTVEHSKGLTFDISFYSGEPGDWTLETTLNDQNNGTFQYEYSDYDEGETTYYWKVEATDSGGNVSNEIYQFTTIIDTDDYSYYKEGQVCDANNSHQMNLVVSYDDTLDGDEDVGCNEHCNVNFSDVRFVDTNTNTMLDYWIESKTDSDEANIYVQLPDNFVGQSSDIVRMYYGNSSKSSRSDKDSVFSFWDDFDSLNTSVWSKEGESTGSISIVDGKLKLDDSGNDGISVETIDNKFTAGELKTRFYIYANDDIDLSIRGGSNMPRFACEPPGSDDYQNYYWNTSDDTQRDSDTGISTGWHTLSMIQVDGYSKLVVDESTFGEHTHSNDAVTTTLRLYIGEDKSQYAYFDYVRLFDYADPDPYWCGWSEEYANHAPSVSNPSPEIDERGVDFDPTISVEVSHPDSLTMDVNFRTNATGSWTTIHTTSGISSGTAQYDTSGYFDEYATKYYWSTNVSDSNNAWTNNTYYFESDYDYSGYNFTRTITIDHNYVDSDITGGFVIPMKIDETFAGYMDEGKELAFASNDDGDFSYEIEEWSTEHDSYVFVRTHETITSATDYTFKMYFEASFDNYEEPDDVWQDYNMTYHFSELSGNIIDKTGNEYHATPANSPTYDEGGTFGRAMSFNSVNSEYCAINNNTYDDDAYSELLTLSLIRCSDTNADNSIVSFDNGEYFNSGFASASGYPSFDIDGNSIDGDEDVTVDDWKMITTVFDNKDMKLYINEHLNNSDTLISNTFGSGNTRYGFIGVNSDATSYDGTKTAGTYYDGKIDEVNVRNSVPDNVNAWVKLKYNLFINSDSISGADETWGTPNIIDVSPADSESCVEYGGDGIDVEFTLSDPDNDKNDVQLWIQNDDNSWYLYHTMSDIYDGDYVWNNIDNFTWANKEYTFAINSTDEVGHYTNSTYTFTTAEVPTINVHTPADDATGVCFVPTINVNTTSTCNASRDIKFYENSTGSFVLRQTNSSVYDDTTVKWDFTNAVDIETDYWWRVVIDIGYDNTTTYTYHFTTDNTPHISSYSPASGSTGLDFQRPLEVTVTNNCTAGDVKYYDNTSGTWSLIGTNSSVSDGSTVSQVYENADVDDTKYWWKVELYNGHGDYREYIYNFTVSQLTIDVNYPTNQSTNIEKNPTISLYANDTDTREFDITWYTNDSDVASDYYYDMNWDYKKKIVIDNTKISSDYTNQPLYFDMTDSDLQSNAQSDGDDILFTDNNGNKLNHELISYDSGTGHLKVWVNITALSSTSDTVIMMYYGNGDCSAQENPTGTWNSDFVGVYHFEDSSGSIEDSTDGNRDGSASGNPSYSQTGKLGSSIYLDGDDYFSVPLDSEIRSIPSDSFTIISWFKTSNDDDDKHYVYGMEYGAEYIWSEIDAAEAIATRYRGGGASTGYIGAWSVDSGNWKMSTLRSNTTNWYFDLNDGSKSGSDTSLEWTQDSNDDYFQIGATGDGNEHPNEAGLIGYVDELFLISNWISDDHRGLYYDTMSSPSTFYTVQDQITIDYEDGDEWIPIQTNYSVPDGTLSKLDYEWAEVHNTTEWWKVTINCLNNSEIYGSQTEIYHFTTAIQTSIDNWNPKQDEMFWSVLPDFNVTVSDSAGNNNDIYMYEQTSNSPSFTLFNQSFSNANGTYEFSNNSWISGLFQEHTYRICVKNDKNFWNNKTIDFKHGRESDCAFRFTNTPSINDAIIFTETSTNSTAWNWTIDTYSGNEYAETQNHTKNWTYMGSYTINLTINDGYTYWQTGYYETTCYVGYNQTIEEGTDYLAWMGNTTTISQVKSEIGTAEDIYVWDNANNEWNSTDAYTIETFDVFKKQSTWNTTFRTPVNRSVNYSSNRTINLPANWSYIVWSKDNTTTLKTISEVDIGQSQPEYTALWDDPDDEWEFWVADAYPDSQDENVEYLDIINIAMEDSISTLVIE